MKNNNNNPQLMSLIGAGAGAYFGGLPGAALGEKLGSTVGSMSQTPEKKAPPQLEPSQSAIQRRMSQINDTPLRQIADSIDSLKYIQDPVQRQELAQPLLQAQYVAMQKGQV